MFYLSSEDLGYIGMIKVSHDDAGAHSCWRLSKGRFLFSYLLFIP